MADYDWTGTGSGTGSWGDATNWGNAGVPSSGDNANVGVSDTITGTGEADELTVSTSPDFEGTFTIDFAQFYGIDVTIGGMFNTTTSFDLQSGAVTVTSGGDLEADNSSIDAAATIEGTLDVDGGTFNTQGGVNVGDSNAAGTLYIEDGAQADFNQSSGTYAALSVDGDGDAYIDDATLDTGGVSIGYTDEGYMSVDNGATVTAASQDPTVYAGLGLAKEAGTSGELDVTDGSTFTISSGGVSVGEEGDGTLDIDDSAFKDTDSSDGSMTLGADDGGSGTVDFDNSDVSIAQTLIVGGEGNATLTMEDNSTVDVNALLIANGEDSGPAASGSPMVSDDDATLTIADALTVGETGTGTFSISDGGTVTADSLDVAVEQTSGSPSEGTPSDLNIDGDGTMLTVKGAGSIGDGGYGTMELTGGATASFENLDIAVQASSGSTDDGLPSAVTLDGDETSLMVMDTLTVGDAGFGYMEVSDGATVTADSLVVAAQETSGEIGPDHETGGVTGEPSGIYLHDSGTSLSVDEDVAVGDGGFGYINVFDGSSMSASSIDIAVEATSGDPASHDESYVEVNNADSTMTVGGNVTVGDAGYGGFTVFDGASATVGGDLDIGEQATSGTAETQSFVGVQDEGSSLRISGTTTVGDAGNGSLYIGDGGTFTTGGDGVDVGKQTGSTGLLEIDGSTATLDLEGTLTIGDAGTGTLDLEDGATLTADGDVTLGAQESGVGSINITGDDSQLMVQGNLVLGEDGTGNLTVGDGGDLSVMGNVSSGNSTVDIEGDPTIAGDAFVGVGTVDNAGNITSNHNSTWTLGNGATLTVQGSFEIGYYPGDTGTVTVTDQNTDLTIGKDLIVADLGTGYLTLLNNASVSADRVGVGAAPTGDGMLMVEDGASLSIATALVVGQYGLGSLWVQDGATLTYEGDPLVIGEYADSSGFVLFQGQATTIDYDGALAIGLEGTGTFELDNNISVTNSDVVLGVEQGSQGIVQLGTLIGSTTWTITGDLTDGEAGTGGIKLFNNDTVTVAAELILGQDEGSTGTLTNQDGSITVSGAATIGEDGDGNFYGSRGSLTTFKSDLTLADGEDSTALMSLIGGAEVDASSQQVIVGQDGSATIEVMQGSLLDVSGGDVVLGADENGYGEIDVDGSTPDTKSGQPSEPSEFDVDNLTVGEDGSGVLTVTDGGIVQIASSLNVGADSEIEVESGGSITIGGDLVFGQASTFSASGKNQGTTIQVVGNLTTSAKDLFRLDDSGVSVEIGGDAQFVGTQLVDNSNELDISGAMTLSPAAGDTDTFTATDEGTTIVVDKDVTVGDAGVAEIDVLAGASVSNGGALALGSQAAGQGTIDVSGDGSIWTAGSGDVTIGDAGNGSVSVDTGATFDATANDVTLGAQSGSVGYLTVSDDSSAFDAASLTIGSSGTGTVTLSGGGSLDTGDLTLGEEDGGDGTVTVADADSSLSVDGDLEVGAAGKGTLVIDGDSTVSGETTVGGEASGTGQITVNTATLELGGETKVGEAGSGSILVQQGGTLTAHEVTLGDELGSSGTLTVDGDGTTMTTEALTVGSSGPGTLNITDGALLTSSDDSTLGDLASANVATAVIDTQGIWSITGGLTVGDSGIADMTIKGGGNVAATDDVVLGDQSGGASGEVDVNATSADGSSPSGLGFGGTLQIGNGGTGILKISGGALVAPTSGGKGLIEIAAQGGSTGSISVDGSGSELAGETLTIGGTDKTAGGSGSLTISDQGLVDVNDVTVWGNGVITLAGGQLETDPITDGGKISGYGGISGDITDDGTIAASGGKLSLSGTVSGGGSLIVDTESSLHVQAASASVAVSFDASGSDETLGIGAHADFFATVSGFTSGNTIDLEDIGFSTSDAATLLAGNILQVGYAGGEYDLHLNPSQNYTGDIFHLAADTSGTGTDVDVVACYCKGTFILAQDGETPVEMLAIGDKLMTATGTYRAIKWIGRRAYSGRFIIGKRDILPICFKVGSIDENIPSRDLWISPHHAMYLDGLLIEAKDLVNGVSIVHAAQVEHVEYFHIELDSHDVIVAEGALSETFIDDDSRGIFHNAHEYRALYPGEVVGSPSYYAPRFDSGYEIEAVRRRLAERAGIGLNRSLGIGALWGHIDLARPDRITGWAQNIDHPEAPVCLDICVGGRLIGQTLANIHREDLRRAGIGSGNHSFEFRPPRGWDVQSGAIEVRRSLDGVALEDAFRASA